MTAEMTPPQQFKEVLAHMPAPVSVITTMTGARPHGTTVSAVTSLSLSPPMVLACLDASSDLLGFVRSTGTFGVNLLSSGQSELAMRFASKGAGKFDGITWWLNGGNPRLPGICGFLSCELADLVDGGDHVIALGNVRSAHAYPILPLTYHSRTFGTHAAHPAVGP